MLGWCLIVIGIPITLLPTPFGIVLVVCGIALVGRRSPILRRTSVITRRLLHRWAALNIPLISQVGRMALQVQQDISHQLQRFPDDW